MCSLLNKTHKEYNGYGQYIRDKHSARAVKSNPYEQWQVTLTTGANYTPLGFITV